MLKEARKKGFMMVALLAVITSMFKLSVVETTVISSPSKSQHSSKTSFNHLQNNTFVLLFESDSENFGNEKSDDEAKSFSISCSYFTRFQDSTLRLEIVRAHA